MVNFGIKIGKIIDHILLEKITRMLPVQIQDRIFYHRESIEHMIDLVHTKGIIHITQNFIQNLIRNIYLTISAFVMSIVLHYYEHYCVRWYKFIIVERDNLIDIIDRTMRRYPTFYDYIFYLFSMNMNRETAINMYHEIAVDKITSFIDSVNDEISSDDRTKDHLDSLGKSVINVAGDIKHLIEAERERLYRLSNYELYKLSDTMVIKNINQQIDAICADINRMLRHDGLPRRFIRDDSAILIIKVSEEIKDNVWNVVQPWSQKYCVSQQYLKDIDIKDIEKEFQYYPSEEMIHYLTGDVIKCIVFPRTSLSKILKVISGVRIRKTMSKTDK